MVKKSLPWCEDSMSRRAYCKPDAFAGCGAVSRTQVPLTSLGSSDAGYSICRPCRNNWRAAINVQNLFDVRYFQANNFGRVAIEPVAPLTIVGSVSVDF